MLPSPPFLIFVIGTVEWLAVVFEAKGDVGLSSEGCAAQMEKCLGPWMGGVRADVKTKCKWLDKGRG